MVRRGRRAAWLAIAVVVVLAAPVAAAPAELDPTFGDGGVASIALHEGEGFTFQVSDLAVAADGSMTMLGGALRVGSTPFSGFDFDVAVAKLLPGGGPDPSFGDEGVARFDLGGFDLASRVAVDGEGGVFFSAITDGSDRLSPVLGRLTPTGELDADFGEGGVVTFDDEPIGFAGDVVVDDEGRPAVAMTVGSEEGNDESARAIVVRLTNTGEPDATFGSGGTATVVGSGGGALGLARTADGGYAVSGATPTGLLVAVLDGVGALVPTFGTGGVAELPVAGGNGWTVAVDDGGSIVTGGLVGQRSGVLARLDSTGRPEASFGIGGVRTVRASDGATMPVMGVGIGPARSVTFVGPQLAGTPQAVVGRVLASGLEDAGFGGDGFVHPLEGRDAESSSAATALTVDGDGRPLAAGITARGDGVEGFATRFRAVPIGSPVAAGQARRVAGEDRIATAVALSGRVFAVAGETAGRTADTAVLAAAHSFPDALVAAPYAAVRNGPLLLNPTDQLDPRVRDELARVLPSGSEVTVMGGFAAIGPAVESQLRAAGYQVTRLAGNDRYETSVAVAEALQPSAAVLARGDDFPDALAAGPAAAEINGVVLLTAGATMPDPVGSYLRRQSALHRFAVGGQAAAADPDSEPVAGANRYETAAAVAARFFHTPARTVVASGERFPDALSGGTLAALTGSPLLLSQATALPAGSEQALERLRRFHRAVTVAGGTAVLSNDVLAAVRAAAAIR